MMIINNAPPGSIISCLNTCYPSELSVMTGARKLSGGAGTVYGYVLDGELSIKPTSRPGPVRALLSEGCFFSTADGAELEASGRVAMILRLGFRGQFSIGHLEDAGRLSYIDGCSDSLLVYPPRRGDPVLNHLHFPPQITQSQHTHPTIRLGIVTKGAGRAWGPLKRAPGQSQQPDRHFERDGRSFWSEPLERGDVFLIHPQEIHSFETSDAQGMDVIAFHPDSDWGPEDENHPMLNRTFLRAR